MIVSASRRTDIPGLYSGWFMNRIRAGYCLVSNPYRPTQVKRVALEPLTIEAIVFWTRFCLPLLPHLAEVTARGFSFYFLYTLTNYPLFLEPGLPGRETLLDAFSVLSDTVGSDRVVWRYDPIIISNWTDIPFHQKNLEQLSGRLEGKTHRLIVSLLDPYRKTQRRLSPLSRKGFSLIINYEKIRELPRFFFWLAELARSRGMEILSCAEDFDLGKFGIPSGKCIDDALIRKVLGKDAAGKKDPYQRKQCRCVVSTDIGRYNTCIQGCRYCYAVSSQKKAVQNYRAHHPRSSEL